MVYARFTRPAAIPTAAAMPSAAIIPMAPYCRPCRNPNAGPSTNTNPDRMKPARQLSNVQPAIVLIRSVNPAIPVEFMFGFTAGTSPLPPAGDDAGADVAVVGAEVAVAAPIGSPGSPGATNTAEREKLSLIVRFPLTV